MSAAEIRVMIVDDEAIIRKGLMKTVPWDKYGMRVVADAPNGARGWEAFLEHKPEVLITDIVMPEMNGIELSQKVKEHAPETKILLLSCHRDFEYAQQGLRIGASGYVLKTSYNDDELEGYLAEFRKDIRHASSADPVRDEEADAQKLFLEWLYRVGGRFPERFDRLYAREWSWMQETGRAYCVTGVAERESAALREQFQRLCDGRVAMLQTGEESFFLLCPERSAIAVDRRLSEGKAESPGMRWFKSDRIATREEWLNHVRKMYGQLELERKYKLQVDNWPDKITEAVRFMVEHIDMQLSVTMIADQAGLSRSHFSVLFKKVVGDSFITFLYRVKLKAACELLGTTGLTIQEISDKVGMPDAKYFSKWFKRCTGRTPSQYRSNHDTAAV